MLSHLAKPDNIFWQLSFSGFDKNRKFERSASADGGNLLQYQ